MTGIVMITIGRDPDILSIYGDNDYLENYW